MKIAIIGAGAWGTALAVHAVRFAPAAHQVQLYTRNLQQADAIRTAGENRRYLPGIDIPQQLGVTTWQADAASLQQQDLVVLATPVAALRDMLTQLSGCTVPVVWLCKGFEQAQSDTLASSGAPYGLMPHEVLAQVAPNLCAGVFSGPSFAQEVARGLPAALVAASADSRVPATLVDVFHGPSLRVYASDDVVGVEVGGAVKNVLAIATGLCDGLQLGMNARAALITRGLHEMTGLGIALGARRETFMGLSGLGDLVLTATGDLSRNRRVGLALANGQSLADVVRSLGHVAEGVYCARTVVRRSRQLGVDMPICSAVDGLLDGALTPAQAVAALMGRDARSEA